MSISRRDLEGLSGDALDLQALKDCLDERIGDLDGRLYEEIEFTDNVVPPRPYEH